MIEKTSYRIKAGFVKNSGHSIPFDFGFIEFKDGLFYLDLYINSSFNLVETLDKIDGIYGEPMAISSETVENEKIELNRLAYLLISPSKHTLRFVSYGNCKITKEEKDPNPKSKNEDTISEYKPRLYYLLLEGLQIEHCDLTQKVTYRGGRQIQDFNNFKRDHTSTALHYNMQLYNQRFLPTESENFTLVEFNNESNGTLTYDDFNLFRDNYISFLGLANGAEVRIRKEFTGKYCQIEKASSEVEITYSYPKLMTVDASTYIPIGDPGFRSSNILNRIFISSFDKFCDINKRIDINSIVYYINNAHKIKSVNESTFIKIIAFERLTTLYAEDAGVIEEFEPSNEDFKEIKEELISILLKFKERCGASYNTLKSKLSNLNQIKKLSTIDKMYRILGDTNIEVTKDIENLINVVRHKTVHKGEFGRGNNGVKIYYLLDELIREVILRLIEYKGERNSRILLRQQKNMNA